MCSLPLFVLSRTVHTNEYDIYLLHWSTGHSGKLHQVVLRWHKGISPYSNTDMVVDCTILFLSSRVKTCYIRYKETIFIFTFCASCSTWGFKVRLQSTQIPRYLENWTTSVSVPLCVGMTGRCEIKSRIHFVLSLFCTSLRLCRDVWRTLKADWNLDMACFGEEPCREEPS